MRAMSPTGAAITGTLEKVYGVAQIGETDWTRAPGTGLLEFEYGGYTEIDWNSQVSVLRDLERVFVDENGEDWLESEIVLEDDEEDD